MHPYSVNIENKRSKVFWIIAVSSIGLFFILEQIGLIDVIKEIINFIPLLKYLTRYSVLTLTITPFLLFKLLYNLMNKKLWRMKYLNKWLGIPDISGRYEGTLYSSYNGGTERKMELEVKQTFSEIKFTSVFEKSSSDSSMAAMMNFDGKQVVFIFGYASDSMDIKVESNSHKGMNRLKFNLGENIVVGDYFTDRGSRPNKGNMTLKKITE